MSPEEIEAVVGVAKDANMHVTAHAHGALSIKQAIRSGVNSIEHASLIDEEGIQMQKNMAWLYRWIYTMAITLMRLGL